MVVVGVGEHRTGEVPGFCTMLLDVIVRQNDDNTIAETWQYATPVVIPTKKAQETYCRLRDIPQESYSTSLCHYPYYYYRICC